jgi:hypothetical protein
MLFIQGGSLDTTFGRKIFLINIIHLEAFILAMKRPILKTRFTKDTVIQEI